MIEVMTIPDEIANDLAAMPDDLFEDAGVYIDHALTIEEEEAHVNAINRSMTDIGRRADILRSGDNWKIVNVQRKRDNLPPIPNWVEYCRIRFNASRQEIDRQRATYIATKNLPVNLTIALSQSQKVELAKLPEDQRLPVLEEAWETVPRNQYGNKMSAHHLKNTAVKLFGQPTPQAEPEPKPKKEPPTETSTTATTMNKTVDDSLRHMKGWAEQALEGDVSLMREALRMIIREIGLLKGEK